MVEAVSSPVLKGLGLLESDEGWNGGSHTGGEALTGKGPLSQVRFQPCSR